MTSPFFREPEHPRLSATSDPAETDVTPLQRRVYPACKRLVVGRNEKAGLDGDLNTLANLAEILGAIVVLGGVAFAVIQIGQFRRQRLEAASVELVRSFQSADFNRAFTLLLDLPKASSASELGQRGADAETQAMILSTTFESIGVLVYNRILPIEIVEQLIGGTVVSFWGKLQGWVTSLRDEQGRADTHEWFQWLAEQLQRRSASQPSTPAYEAYREWRG